MKIDFARVFAVVCALSVMMTNPTWAGELVPGALREIEQVRVTIDVWKERFPETSELQRWAERRLKDRGVRLASDKNGTIPALNVIANVTDECVYVVRAVLLESATLTRAIGGIEDRPVSAVTWTSGSWTAHAPSEHCWSMVSARIKDSVDKFADALFEAGVPGVKASTASEGAPIRAEPHETGQ